MKVLSYNIWGIFTAPSVDLRMKKLATAEMLGEYDIVCLQEQFDEPHFKIIREGTQATHPYFYRFQTSAVGNGLLTLSKYPIVDSIFQEYYVQGCAEKIWLGDYYCNKGISFTRIRVPKSVLGGERDESISVDDDTVDIAVYNTHTVACYQKYSEVPYEKEINSGYRMSQLLQAVKFIESTARTTDQIVFCGDFNIAGPNSPEMKMIKAHFASVRKPAILRSVFDAPEVTYSDENPWNGRSTNPFRLFALEEDKPVQLDFMWYSSDRIKVRQSKVAMKDGVCKVPDGSMKPLSDHWAVTAEFEMIPSGEEPEAPSPAVDSVEPSELRYAASFLIRRSHDIDRERRRFLIGMPIFLILIPILFTLAFGSGVTLAAGLVSCGFCGAVCLIVGRVSRANNGFTLRYQGEELKKQFGAL